MIVIDLIGRRFGRLVVERRTSNSIHGASRWVCYCDCGGTTISLSNNLKRGISQSCGCIRKKIITKHSMHNTAIYHVWENMKQRCYNKNNKDYKNYGGRGISICKEWRESFEVFYKDMGDPPSNLTLDRINNDDGYFSNNCRWVSRSTQSLNQRRSVS